MALNSSQEQQATTAIRSQVAQFKTDAVRMPSPFNTMLLQSANAFENTIADDTYRQIRDEFHKIRCCRCQASASGRYPMDHGARNEIGLADFGRLFGGGGYFDSFFKVSGNLRRYLAARVEVAARKSGRQVNVGRNAATVSAGEPDQWSS